MIDGKFAPLDMIFSDSEMLMILRSTPVGQYLQPTGNWDDGLVRTSLLLIGRQRKVERRSESVLQLWTITLRANKGTSKAAKSTAKTAPR